MNNKRNYGRLLKIVIVSIVTSTAFFSLGTLMQSPKSGPVVVPQTEVVLESASLNFENAQKATLRNEAFEVKGVTGNDSPTEEAEEPNPVPAEPVPPEPPKSEPTPQKAEPTSQKAEPTSQKAEPTSQKAEPTSQKAEPTSQKAEPTSQKAEPTSQKAEPTSQKAEPTSQNAEPTSQKAEPTSQKAEPTPQKAEPTPQKAEPTLPKQDSTPASNTERLKNYSVLRNVTSSPVTQFVFTKIEKTGSSTFFAVLSRFVKKHKLNILMQKKRVHIDWTSPKGVGWDIGPARVSQADVLINHALYKKSHIDKYIKPDYKFIVMVREPVSWFKSATKYYNYMVGGNTPEQVINTDSYLYLVRNNQNGGPTGLSSWFHLVQLQWLGFDYKQKGNMTAITEYIAWLNKQIDLVMINEQYDPSLVVLRRRFGWSYTDIFYRRYIITNSKDIKLSDRARDKLLSAKVNLGEKLLYDTLNHTWWNQPELKENSFWDEVKFFSELNLETTQKFCPAVLASKKPYSLPSNKWCPPEQLTVEICSQLLEKRYDMMMKGLGNYALGSAYHY